MAEIEIYWDDLKKEKQQEILRCLGENGNYDVIPIASIPHENELARMVYDKVYIPYFSLNTDRVNQEPVCFNEFLNNEWMDEDTRLEYLKQAVEQKVIGTEAAQASMAEFSEAESDIRISM